ncbi:MAG: lysozyme [Nitrospira sp.]|jgi:GH24 family phage-related lysozyme (muramidase)|nr:MAG: lysozyme [Nitrospira sp.]
MLNYHSLTQQQYVDLLVSTISSFEGPAATVYQKPDDHTTIGYGYTFFRSNNLALWQAAGITLTSAEVTLLQSIDAAPNNQKDSLALQFTRSISTTEAVALLRQTYPQYEGPANTLLIPFSNERAAFVSLTYNRATVKRGRVL